MKFRRKSPVVEALQREKGNDEAVRAFGMYWVSYNNGKWWVTTKRGTKELKPGDWLVRVAEGEFEVWGKAAFEEAFEAAEDA